jgi:fumarylpyruvate hydrolase
MNFAIERSRAAELAVAGEDLLFPVRRVYCVGRNYADHVREMGFDPSREPPFFFCKPNDTASVVACHARDVAQIPYPPATRDYHYEGELVVAIGRRGKDVAVADAMQHVWGYAAGLDMTRRDLQVAARKAGRPWESGKAFDYSAPVGPLVRASAVPDIESARLELCVNGATRQQAGIRQLIWSVPEIISRLSFEFELHPGDIIFTGTPSGIGAVTVGQQIQLQITGLPVLRVQIA